MALSDQLSKLAARAKEAEDHARGRADQGEGRTRKGREGGAGMGQAKLTN